MNLKLEWIVPIIVLVVYVIGWILKAKEDIDAKVKKPAGKEPGRELDRFLEEIDRLRREQANKPAPVVESYEDQEEVKPAPVVVRPVPVLPPRPVIIRRPPRLIVEAPPPVPVRLAAPVAPVTQSTMAVVSEARSVSPKPIRRSDTVATVMGLLQSPRAISSALILNEIIGPPKSKRI